MNYKKTTKVDLIKSHREQAKEIKNMQSDLDLAKETLTRADAELKNAKQDLENLEHQFQKDLQSKYKEHQRLDTELKVIKGHKKEIIESTASIHALLNFAMNYAKWTNSILKILTIIILVSIVGAFLLPPWQLAGGVGVLTILIWLVYHGDESKAEIKRAKLKAEKDFDFYEPRHISMINLYRSKKK